MATCICIFVLKYDVQNVQKQARNEKKCEGTKLCQNMHKYAYNTKICINMLKYPYHMQKYASSEQVCITYAVICISCFSHALTIALHVHINEENMHHDIYAFHKNFNA